MDDSFVNQSDLVLRILSMDDWIWNALFACDDTSSILRIYIQTDTCRQIFYQQFMRLFFRQSVDRLINTCPKIDSNNWNEIESFGSRHQLKFLYYVTLSDFFYRKKLDGSPWAQYTLGFFEWTIWALTRIVWAVHSGYKSEWIRLLSLYTEHYQFRYFCALFYAFHTQCILYIILLFVQLTRSQFQQLCDFWFRIQFYDFFFWNTMGSASIERTHSENRVDRIIC